MHGRETATIAAIRSYKARTNCLTSGQVLGCDYSFDDAKLIVKLEMMDLLCLEMVEKNLVSDSVTLQVGYSRQLAVESSRGQRPWTQRQMQISSWYRSVRPV